MAGWIWFCGGGVADTVTAQYVTTTFPSPQPLDCSTSSIENHATRRPSVCACWNENCVRIESVVSSCSQRQEYSSAFGVLAQPRQ